MRDRDGGGLKIVQICVTSFINAPLTELTDDYLKKVFILTFNTLHN